MSMSATNKTSQARAQSLDHQRKAMELRRMGLGYVEIGSALGISKSQAHRLVVAALTDSRNQVAASADELRAVELSRLDGVLNGLWPAARKGALGAIDRVLKISERRSKLLGLDAPERKVLTGANGGPVQTVTMTPAEFAKIAAEVAAKV